jgi:hypothetical protein
MTTQPDIHELATRVRQLEKDLKAARDTVEGYRRWTVHGVGLTVLLIVATAFDFVGWNDSAS